MTMESLDLPKELYWDLKMEPASPTSAVASELFSLNEPTVSTYLYDDNFANECLLDQKAPSYIDYDINSFHSHFDVTSADGLVSITKVQIADGGAATESAELPQADASMILQQLTPPQSPPQFDGYQQQQQKEELVNEEQKLLYATATTTTAAAAYNFNNGNNWTAGSEIAREMQLVDEIVNMRAQEMQLPTNWQQYNDNDDCDSQSSSSIGSLCDSSGAGSSIADADEDEWMPASSSSSSCGGEEKSAASAGASGKKRTRTYGRGVEDRKIRKKEQNKNAATRYRQKKKIEMESVLGEEQVLQQLNDKLRCTLAEKRSERRYLRQLIREFYQSPKQA
ncbi:crc [Drosophila busckii]|uniref:Crc n=1 Tax=Drosophila busckii TaxID=30019 RepID=A0A0M4ER09_DROBS|nr:crc [Drosophila busckii]